MPLGELLDALDDTAHTANGATASSRVVVHHPLQPFDPRPVKQVWIIGEVLPLVDLFIYQASYSFSLAEVSGDWLDIRASASS